MVTPLLRLLAVLFTCILYVTACVPVGKVPTGPVKGINDTATKWFDWVGAFKPDLDSSTRATYLNNVRNQLLAVRSDYTPPASDSVDRPYTYYLYNHIRDSFAGSFQVLNVNVQFCNCPDDRVWNVIADLGTGRTDTTGESTPTSPKPPSGTVVKGEAVDALSDNEDMSNPGSNGGELDMSGVVTFDQFETSRAVIAIIDTGLDTLLLTEQVRRAVLWNGPSGGQNLLMGANVNNYTDDHNIRHGTAVSTIAMKAFNKESSQRQLPKLMTLKAADAAGRGTLFEYTCALAFAINNNANVINSSMGFYGQPTEVIESYLRLAKSKNIAVVAAAGNGDSTHDVPLCRGDINPANKLQSPRLFYPAVFAQDQEHYMILSVTGKSEPGNPCYHQNYSSDYVTLGVVNMPQNSSCCFFLLPFIGQGRGLEGSSFATPVVSGRLAFKALQGAPPSSVRNCLDKLGDVNTSGGGGPVTQANQYIEYTP
jgi:hypothetical protein